MPCYPIRQPIFPATVARSRTAGSVVTMSATYPSCWSMVIEPYQSMVADEVAWWMVVFTCSI